MMITKNIGEAKKEKNATLRNSRSTTLRHFYNC